MHLVVLVILVEELMLVELQRGRDGERARPRAVLGLKPQLVLFGRQVLLGHGAAAADAASDLVCNSMQFGSGSQSQWQSDEAILRSKIKSTQ